MEHPVRSRNNLYLLWLTALLLSCHQKHDQQRAAFFVRQDTVQVTVKQGITYINQQPANAMLFSVYDNGDTSMVQAFANGKENGQMRSWYSNRQLKEYRFFNKGWQEQEAKGWWPDGKQRFVYHFAGDVYEGNVKEWSADGLLVKDMNYHKGQEEGAQRQWYPNGVIRSNYIIKNGRRYGLLGTKNCVNVADSIPALQ